MSRFRIVLAVVLTGALAVLVSCTAIDGIIGRSDDVTSDSTSQATVDTISDMAVTGIWIIDETTKAPETEPAETTGKSEDTVYQPETTQKAPETTEKTPETTEKAPETTEKEPETTYPVIDDYIYMRVNENGAADEKGGYILFGSYPTKCVTDPTLEYVLNTKYGEKPTSTEANGWTDMGYYAQGEKRVYTWYKDIEYAGTKYRAIYFTEYRPYYPFLNNTVLNSRQDDNGYEIGKVYWFRYMPIMWKILGVDNKDGASVAVLMSRYIIDSQEYYTDSEARYIDGKTVNSGNYLYSNIRSWLNGDFYAAAFTPDEAKIINGVTSGETAGDRVSLLSYDDITNTSYGFSGNAENNDPARIMTGTDYAQANGLFIRQNGYTEWYLRSVGDNAARVSVLNTYGGLTGTTPEHTDYGIVPTLTITLD